jgi:hypothetical protein
MTISIIVSMASLDRVGACVSLAIFHAECIVHIKEYSWSKKEALHMLVGEDVDACALNTSLTKLNRILGHNIVWPCHCNLQADCRVERQ